MKRCTPNILLLYAELLACQSGARSDKPMGNAVRYLKDDALVKVSAYHADLESTQPSSAGAAKPVPARTPLPAEQRSGRNVPIVG